MNPTDEKNATELEHSDGRGPTAVGEYQPKVSNVLGHMNYDDYFPDDESQRVESAPLSTLKAFSGVRCDETTIGADGNTVDALKE